MGLVVVVVFGPTVLGRVVLCFDLSLAKAVLLVSWQVDICHTVQISPYAYCLRNVLFLSGIL